MTPTRDDLTATLLGAALDAAARGWHVFPLIPNGKRPALHGTDRCPATGACATGHLGWEQRATTEPDRIQAAWSTGAFNIGIATGPSGLVVIDLDTPKGGARPGEAWGLTTFQDLCRRHGHAPRGGTCEIDTPSGGLHLYYAHPATGPQLRNTAGKLGPMIDTRAHGGYVVGPGSITSTGDYYPGGGKVPVAPLPAWLADLLTPAPLPPQQPVRVDVTGQRLGRYLETAIEKQLAEITNAAPGNRNHSLYVSAAALGQLIAGGSLPEHLVRDLLTHAATTAGLGARETERTINSGLRAGAQRPRTVAA